MKHSATSLLFAITILIALFSVAAFAQIGGMVFSSSAGTYTEITGGTVLGTISNDDGNFLALPIGFTFNFNGADYTQVSVNTNGFLAMGATVSSSYTAISSGSSNNIVVANNHDLQGQTGSELSYLTQGTSPNQTFTVQWKNYRHYLATGDICNFQIILHESSNRVDVVYGSFTQNATNRTPQVGLRGASSADYNNRSVTNGINTWATSVAGATNAATCDLQTALVPASGLTYTWAPFIAGANDYAAFSLDTPPSGGTVTAGTAFSPIATFKNVGSSPQPAGTTVRYQILNSVPAIVYNNPQTLGALAAGATEQKTFSSVAGGLAAGTYTIRAISYLAGDANAANDTLSGTLVSVAPISSFPYTQGFLGVTFPPTGWSRSGAKNWQRYTGDFHGDSASAGIAYSPAGVGILQSPPFALPAGYRSNFWWKDADVFSPAIQGYDTTYFEITTNGGTTWTTLAFLSEPTSTTGWHQQIVDLSAYAGTVFLRWRDVSDGTFSAYGTWLDDILIEAIPSGPPDSAHIVSPANLATNVLPIATLNWSAPTGGGAVTGYKLYFGTDNPPTNIVNGTNLGNVLTYDPSPNMTYSTPYYWKVVPTGPGGDAVGCPIWSFTVEADPTQPLPYFQDFNASTSLPAGWTADMYVSSTHGASGTNGLYRNLYSSVPTCYATMPPVGPITSASRLLFDYRIVKYSGYPATPDTLGAHDSLNVLVSTDGGSSFSRVLTIDTTNHVPSTSFAGKNIALGPYAGSNVVVKFSGKWGSGDYYVDIDNVVVDNAVAKDIKVFSVLLSPTTPGIGQAVTVSAVIQNFGTEPNPASVPLTYKIGSVPASSGDGTAQTFTPTWTGNTDTVTFSTTYTPGAIGSLTVCVRSFYAGDLVGSNDSAKVTTTVIPDKDIEIQFISLSPGPPYYPAAPITVSAQIRNNGTEPNPSSVPVTYKIGSAPGSVGDGTTQTFTPTWTGNVDTVTFTTTYTPGSTGGRVIYARSFYPGDLVAANDSAKKSIHVLPAGALFEDWTDANALARWKVVNNDGGAVTWVRSTSKFLSGPASASSQWESSTLQNDDWLITPKLTVAAGDSFTFYHSAYSTSFPESLYVKLSTTGNNPSDFNVVLRSIQDASLGWTYEAIDLTPYVGQNIYVAFVNRGLDEYYVFVDDITGPHVYVPAVDLAVTTFFQTSGLPTPEPNASILGNTQAWSLSTRESDMKPEAKLDTKLVGQNASSTRTVNPTVLLSNVGPLPATDNLEATNLKAAIKNIGLNAASYTFNWKVSGVAQAPYSGPSVPSGSVDSASFSYNASAAGTYLTTGKITVAADEVADNDSAAFRMRVYPASYTRTILDRGDNIVDTFIGWGDTVRSMVACVRFNAAANIRLRGLDMIYRTETKLAGTITVKVRAAGGSTDSVGAVLYSRDFTTADYFTGAGDYVMFPFDSAAAPTIASGSDYWITVKMPVGIQYPGGAHNTGFTTGHSYYEASPDTLKLTPLIITTERAWIMRAIHNPTSTTTTLNVAIASGWNLISNPVTNPIPGDSVRQLYPTSLNAYAFEFLAGYVQRYILVNGKGYWEKFPGAISQSITGTPRTRDSISVVAGWNIVGSISNTVDTSTIVSVPPGLRASQWFGYAAGYTPVTQLVPGKGYWLKSSAAGKFVLANPLVSGPAKVQASGESALDALNTLTITDSRGGSQTLYFGADAKNEIQLPMFVMPPAPPAGALDARFETAEGGSMVQTHAAKVSEPVEFSVAVQSDAYPLTVSWKVNGAASYELTDGRSGQIFRTKEMTGEGSIKITNSELGKFSVKLVGDGQLPADFALSQNYPNPFNPTTSIKFALPVDSRVTMEVYNVLGQRVRTLTNDNLAAGYHAAEWDGTGNAGQQLASGVYFLQMSAKGVNGKSFNEIRKLMMLK